MAPDCLHAQSRSGAPSCYHGAEAAMDIAVPVPAHLRRYVVEQNYQAYTPRDQAVWRFVLLQTHARLLRLAHPAYESGFVAAGIEVDRIPNVARMSEQLASASFRAVCVDGFIP